MFTHFPLACLDLGLAEEVALALALGFCGRGILSEAWEDSVSDSVSEAEWLGSTDAVTIAFAAALVI